MENEFEPAVGGTVGVERHPEGSAETRKEWLAPELRKVEIAEITALNGFTTTDGPMSS
jgi:hypothetical protein